MEKGEDIERMEAIANTAKRKASSKDDDSGTKSPPAKTRLIEEDGGSSPQSTVNSLTPEDEQRDWKVILNCPKRKMSHWHPTIVHEAIYSAIGNYEGIRPLPSGDLLINCFNEQQVKKLLDIDVLTHPKSPIPVTTSRYKNRKHASRAVINGVPSDLSEYEIVEFLSSYGVTFAKRLKRRTDKGLEDTMSVLICFSLPDPPSSVIIGYLRFRTKPFNPPPLRCHNCNRFGHTKKYCGGKTTCSRCGSRDHEYKDCNRDKKCVNCSGNHSSAYTGCPIFKREFEIQKIREQQNLDYPTAKAKVTTPPPNEPTPRRPTYSQVLSPPENIQATNQLRIYPESAEPPANREEPTSISTRTHRPKPPTYPVPNDCNNQLQDTSSDPQLEDNGTSSILSLISSTHPLIFFAYLTEIIALTIAACRANEEVDVSNLVSLATQKWLSLPLDSEALKGLISSYENQRIR